MLWRRNKARSEARPEDGTLLDDPFYESAQEMRAENNTFVTMVGNDATNSKDNSTPDFSTDNSGSNSDLAPATQHAPLPATTYDAYTASAMYSDAAAGRSNRYSYGDDRLGRAV